jgi:putative methyltransferase (TIGR04325 family)
MAAQLRHIEQREAHRPHDRMSLVKRIRILQIRYCSRLLRRISAIQILFPFIRATRELPIVRETLALATGYHRQFSSLSDAAAACLAYEGPGHCDPDHVKSLIECADRAQPSDYPALFYIYPNLRHIRSVFDFGGGAGNLFYCFSKYLEFPSGFKWTVYDLPKNNEFGERLAKDRNEYRLRFSSQILDGDGADLLIACGSLHYFDRSLASMIARFRRMPRYILVNRTPLTDGPAFATVQDAGSHRVACILHNRQQLIQSLEETGYEIVGSWEASERSLVVPCYPDRSASAYSGMFFRLRSDEHVEKASLALSPR